jgi:hypothetical protein
MNVFLSGQFSWQKQVMHSADSRHGYFFGHYTEGPRVVDGNLLGGSWAENTIAIQNCELLYVFYKDELSPRQAAEIGVATGINLVARNPAFGIRRKRIVLARPEVESKPLDGGLVEYIEANDPISGLIATLNPPFSEMQKWWERQGRETPALAAA